MVQLTRCCLAFGIGALLFLNGCDASYTKAPDSCLSNIDAPISNFCQLKQELWRGAELDKDGAAWLIENNVKTIINLELFNDDLDIIGQINLSNPKTFKIDYFRVKDWEPLPALAPWVEDEHVVHFLAIASQQERQPVYVHCRSGENRTGIMIAAYRIIVEGNPDIDAVIEEMETYQGFWSDVDAKYIKGLSLRRTDILRRMKEKILGLENPARIICKEKRCSVDLYP